MKTPIVILATVLGLTSVGIAGAQQTKDQAKFCSSLTAFHADVATFNALGSNATVGMVKSTADRIRNDAENVKKAAGGMNTPASKQFEEAAANLKKHYDSIPPDATVQQTHDQLQGDVQNLKSAAQELATESGCPGATKKPEAPQTPQMNPGQGY